MTRAEPSWLDLRGTELGLAFALLTRLPTPKLAIVARRAVGDYVWAFPIAGLVVGCLSGIALWLARDLGAGRSLGALAGLVVSMLATGALHEDGLADFWDGIGGGRTRARKLEIMRDSAIGSYGAAALFIGLAARWTALGDIPRPADAMGALIVAHTLSRGMLAVVLEYWRPARRDGLAAAAGGSALASCFAVLFALAIAFGFAGVPVALAGLIAAAIGTIAVAAIAGRYLGGYTGDVLGAAQQTAEVLALIAASILYSH